MKAVIMAGGEGTRLRPLSLGSPKPMTPLLGRPVMEHIINLLKRHGITDICVTLCYKPQEIMDYFGSGDRLGVRLTWFIEEEPLGTAGSVKGCMGHLGGEDFLVISGDCICDLDLSQLLRFHRERRAQATLALYRHKTPLEYGLVLTGEDGRVERFVEKPGWGQVLTDQINTGVYLLSSAAMDRVPQGEAFDFGRDLFPALLREGAALFGLPLEGYWCDMGDCGAYLSCACDALSGKIKLDLGLPKREGGFWSAQPLPGGVHLVPPCWIGEGVELGSGCLIGPHAILEKGVSVGERSMVQRSILLENSAVGPRSTLYGAILCRGASARRETVLNEGAVLGENSLAEEGTVLLERVKLWPGQTSPAGCRLARSITSGAQKGTLRFGDSGTIRGVLGEDLGPEALLALGSILGAEGPMGLGCSPTPGAGMLARAAAVGAAAAGSDVLTHSLNSPVQGAGAAVYHQLPASLFVEEVNGTVFLHIFDKQGLPPNHAWQRKLEHALLQGEPRRVRCGKVGRLRQSDFTAEQWARRTIVEARLRRPALRRVTAAVGDATPEDRALRSALTALGCRVEDVWRPGIPAFYAQHGGFSLTAQDEQGNMLDSGQLLALSALIEMENGSGKTAVPAGASAAVELVAAGYGGSVLRLDRDGEQARELYAAQPWMSQAPSAVVRICSRMAVSGQKLETLLSKTPRFSSWRREVPLTSDRGQVMQALAREHTRKPSGEGLRMRTGSGWVYLTPMARRSALRVIAEGPDLELAAELCDFYAGRAAELDRALSEQCAQEEDKE
ncbi:MAG: NTP transferase domain-containing protein [Lawsonibacter sp.]|nr:NTP transferase domain-containing protein [Lawsonibacter sp.]